MKEAFLHYLWKHRKCDQPGLLLTSGDPLFILHPGNHNTLAGPDFLNARIRIGNTEWAGHVEVHIHSSDWYAHKHETDPAYDNVILHVVWHDNLPVLGAAGQPLPTLELRKWIPQKLLISYQELVKRKARFINCEKDIGQVDSFVTKAWLERLYIERLERRVSGIQAHLNTHKNHWEAVFFLWLAQGFGSKINKSEFFEVARHIPFQVLTRIKDHPRALEAIFLGTAGLLDSVGIQDKYQEELRTEYRYLLHKFNLKKPETASVQFYKLRPMNFPTIRLSQLAQLFHLHPRIFARCMSLIKRKSLHSLFKVSTSEYWESHYTFGQVSSRRKKIISASFIDTLLLNVVLPFKFAYLKGREKDAGAVVMKLIREIPPESNAIIKAYSEVGVNADSALESQAILELHQYYCRPNRCLDCMLGHQLLHGK